MNVQEVVNRTEQVASRYVELCREGKNIEAIDELYADNVVSREMPNWPGQTVTEGIKSVVEKNEQWLDTVEEYHSGTVSDPVVAGNHFTVKMGFDATFKERGRQQMEELAILEVDNNGKIVSEQFFYNM